MEQHSRTKLIAAVVLLLVLGSGLFIGYAVHGTQAIAMTANEPRPWVPVYESMNPSQAQLDVIDSITASYRERMNRLHEEFDLAQQAYQSSYDALIAETRNAIAAVFPEERRPEYQRRLEAYDRQRAEERAKQGDLQ